VFKNSDSHNPAGNSRASAVVSAGPTHTRPVLGGRPSLGRAAALSAARGTADGFGSATSSQCCLEVF
jgi:hypothetical protein